MARVILLSATPADDHTDAHLRPLRDLRSKAALDRVGAHSVTSDAEAADVILFVESYGAGWHFERVRRHSFTRRYREKCFIFCNNPFVIPFLPGIYTGIAKRWASRRTVSGFYVGTPVNESVTYEAPTADLPYLFSFTGVINNAAVRGDIARIEHPRGAIRDTSADYARVLSRVMDASERQSYHHRFAEMIKASKFVLCPRGLSVSSVRVFETMKMGRVPVILSDEWVEPRGPVWERFSIRVRESDCGRLPAILEEREHEAIAMGQLARQQWVEWFADDMMFHRAVEWCLAVQNERGLPESLARWPVYLQYLRPFHFRRAVGAKVRALRSSAAGSPVAAVRPSQSRR
jgi:hypothetical protein